MSEEHDYSVLRELIYLYRNHPCLWDAKSPEYKCTSKKNMAWAIMLGKYRELDPDAQLSHVKRKIDNMKACYQRELRKVNKSLLECTSKEDIHEPTLWYYKLFSFLDTKKEMKIEPENYDEFLSKKQQYLQGDHQRFDEQQNEGVYMIIVDDEFEPTNKIARTKSRTPEQSNNEKQKEISHYTKQLKQSIQNTPKGDRSAKANQINPFAVYVGRQLEEMSPYQRKVAEKVISEVIFLGKTDGLNFYSRVENNPRPANTESPSPRSNNVYTPKAKKKITPRRQISPDVTPVRFFPEHKVPQKTRFIDVKPTLLIPRPSPDPLSTDSSDYSDSSPESDGSESESEYELPTKRRKSTKSTKSSISEIQDKDIDQDDSILMTLLKTN